MKSVGKLHFRRKIDANLDLLKPRFRHRICNYHELATSNSLIMEKFFEFLTKFMPDWESRKLRLEKLMSEV